MPIKRVEISKNALRDLKKTPSYIANKLDAWVESVEHDGLEETMKIPGHHDEPLKGERKGQRSIRLSKSYRAIYEIRGGVIWVKEVNKHAY